MVTGLNQKEKEKTKMKLFKKFGKKHVVVLIIALIIGFFLLNVTIFKKQPTDNILANVNSETITLEELNEMRGFLSSSMSELQFLNDVLIPHKLLLQKAKKNKITSSANEVDFALTLFLKQKNLQLESFQQKTDLSENRIRKLMEEQVLISKLVKEVIPPVSITDLEARQFYDSHPDSFMAEGKLIPLEEVKGKVKEMLFDLKLKILVRKYVIQLAEQGEVLIYNVKG